MPVKPTRFQVIIVANKSLTLHRVLLFIPGTASFQWIPLTLSMHFLLISSDGTYHKPCRLYPLTLSPKANAEMRLYNYVMRFSRHEILLHRMGLETINTFDDIEKLIRNHLYNMSETELFRQAQILGFNILDPDYYKRVAELIANGSFHGATFSNRVWANHDLLKQALADGIKKSIMMGQHPTVWMREMSEALQEVMAGSSYALKRLAVTESARVQIEAQKKAYQDNGYTQFEVICEPTACSICRPFDGTIEDVNKMRIGDNAPPFHPNCK